MAAGQKVTAQRANLLPLPGEEVRAAGILFILYFSIACIDK
jgi:hypothetical protein